MAMSVVKKILIGVVTIAALVFAPVIAPVIGGFLGATGFLATAIGSIIIAAGLTVVQSLFANRPQAASIEAGKVNVRIPEPPRWLNCGRARQGGGVLFAEFDGSGNLWFIVVHSDSILVEKYDIYFDEIKVTVDGSGNVTTDDFCLTNKNEPYEGSGTKKTFIQIWTTTYTEGSPVPARVAALDAALGSKWTAEHKLVGTTFSVVMMKALKIEDRYKIYKWRGPLSLGEPNVSVVGQWSNVYDPRDNTQVLGNRATYKPTRNNALVWAWFRTHRFGRAKFENSVNWAKVAEQANVCDQIVTGLTGDQKRYECSTAIPDNKERIVAEQEILMSMDAQLVFDDDGKCWPRAGAYYAPTLRLTRNRDIVAMESVEAQNGESETQGVIVRYIDPEANYTAQPSAPWLNPDYYTPGQAATFLTVDILTCQNHNQAMRLAKAIGKRSQPLHKILPTAGLRGLKARTERICNLNYDNVFAGDYEIATPVEVDATGIFCGFGAVPVDANRWSLLAGEEKPKPVITDYESAPLPAIPTGVVVSYANSRIEATFTLPARDDVGFEFQYIITADISSDNWVDMSVDMNNGTAFSGTVGAGVSYSVRNRAVSGSGRVTAWSSPVAVTGGVSIDPVTMFTGTAGTGVKNLQWRNPNSVSFDHVIIYRNTSNDLGTATNISGELLGGLGQIQTYSDAVASGTRYYWIIAYSVDDQPSATTGPVNV